MGFFSRKTTAPPPAPDPGEQTYVADIETRSGERNTQYIRGRDMAFFRDLPSTSSNVTSTSIRRDY